MVLALGALAVAGCVARAPELDPTEPVRGEHTRLLQIPRAELWPALVAALGDEGLEVARADEHRGTIATRAIRYAERDLRKRLAEIGDLSHVRGAGLGRVSELTIEYYLLLARASDEATSLKIRSAIDAVDRREAVFLAPGVFQIVPRHVPIPSRGVVERDLMRRLVAGMLPAEEVLYLLGEPGVD